MNSLRSLWWFPGGLMLGVVAAGATAPDRVRLTIQHVDIRMVYQPQDPTNKLGIVVVDDDAGRAYRSNEVALVVAESARLALPAGTPFGSEGEPLWVLPQSQDPELLYLGLSAEGLPPGQLAGDLELRLLATDGPARFFAWQASSTGLEVRMNAADGLTAEDRTRLVVGSHEHLNLGFSEPGVTYVVFQVVGRRVGVETNDFSLPTPLRFEVEPLPPPPAPPFARWQTEHWPQTQDPAVTGAVADPDGDGWSNLWEYVLGYDPMDARDTPGPDRPALRTTTEATDLQVIVRLSRVATATDVEFELWTADAVDGPWRRSDLVPTVSGPLAGRSAARTEIAWRDLIAPPFPGQRYYRVAARLGQG